MLLEKILAFDEKITNAIRLKDTDFKLKPVGVFFAHSGDSWFILIALLVIWLTTQGNWHHISAIMAAGAVALAIFVLIIKFSIRRRRPEGDWGAVYRNTDPHSFPSGHAARTAMLAVIALFIGPLWFGIILLIWAPLVSLARVWMGVHYVSDVVAGILLGILAGSLMIIAAPWLTNFIPNIF
jgi:membrane-associated phospholipid phosphatase